MNNYTRKTHNFYDGLKYSEQFEDWKHQFYLDFFGRDAEVCPLIHSVSVQQNVGYDRVVISANGFVNCIEEKVRGCAWRNDVLLEFVHTFDSHPFPFQKPGWIEKNLQCNWIFYAYPKNKIGIFLPWPQLQLVWYANKPKWIFDFPTFPAKNNGYTTDSVAVPVHVLDSALRRITHVGLKGGEL